MQQTLRRNTWLFIGFLLLGGVIHFFNHITPLSRPLMAASLFTVNSLLYMGLIIYWIQSVHTRLLPSRARAYIIASAILMIFFLVFRTVKYRFTINDITKRYLWYAYYLPITMIPAFFLTASICIHRGGKQGKWDERILLIPSSFFSALVLTNDLHYLIFRPKSDQMTLTEVTGSYVYGLSFYALYLCAILMMVIGVFFLIRATRQQSIRKSLPIAAAILLWLIMNLSLIPFTRYNIFHPYETPEIHIFCLLLVFEICIRERLIPHNEDYVRVFHALRQPALICDSSFSPMYYTAAPVSASQAQMIAALTDAVYPEEDQRLFGTTIRGGYAYWMADESALRRLNKQLVEAAKTLAEENSLIEEERKLKEEQARVEARNSLYLKAAEQVYPTQKKIADLLKGIRHDKDNLRSIMAQIMVLNAYTKRRVNFILSKTDAVSAHAMKLALEETARYLPYCGIDAYVDCSAVSDHEYAGAMALYDTFEAVIEALLSVAPHYLLIAYSDLGLRMVAEGLSELNVPPAPLHIATETEENRLTLLISFREGGAS